MLKVGWCGMGGHAWMAEELRPIIVDLGMELVTIHEHPNANIKWERHNWLENLRKMDIIICPANYTVQPNKSANRLTQSMALGKPTICSPLPAYLEVAKKYPGSFLIAENKDEWRERLRLLRDTPTLRDQLVQRGLAAAREFSIDEIGKKWLGVIGDRDVVDIVIPTYKNLRGLRLCLESIRACTDILHNVIIVDNGNSQELHDYLVQQGDIVYIKKAPLNFAQAVNEGIKAGKGKYVCVLNDDVIVSKGWLQEMVNACTEGVGCVGVLSNCDKGWLHQYDLNIGGVDLLPGLNTFEQIEPIVKTIHDSVSPLTEITEREWVAYYCNLIPRSVINLVGFLNEEFTNSGEDVDHCRRIRKMGYKVIQTYKSFVFHFGAVSRKILEQEDPGSYQAADKKTNRHLIDLWGKESVMIYSGPSWERWNHQTMETTGIGGSEVWQILLSRELSNLGYRVINFADCPQPAVWDGDIEWRHYTEYPKYVDEHWVDHAILSRTTDPLRFPLRAGKTFVQIHDVWMLSEKTQLFADRVNKFCALSQWHVGYASDYHGIPKEKMAMTANGIDFDRFDSIQVERQPYRLHWSSSWDRGLDNVLYLWPFIRKQVPEAELHVYYGCYNWAESCKKRGDTEGLKKIEELKVAMKQPGVFDHGRLSQKELAVEIKKASLMLYPTWFSETWGISFIECQYAGVPVIANKYAGLTTTLTHPEIGETAIMLGDGTAYWPYTKEGREAFLKETLLMLTDKARWQEWSEKGKKNAERFSWKNCALRWKRMFETNE
jgi:GT2 family glycosyltransferase